MKNLTADDDTDLCDMEAVDARIPYTPGLYVVMDSPVTNFCCVYEQVSLSICVPSSI